MLIVRFDRRSLDRQMEAYKKRSSNLTPFYRAASNYMVGQTQQRIKQGVSPDGSPFAPLSPLTIARKRREPAKYTEK